MKGIVFIHNFELDDTDIPKALRYTDNVKEVKAANKFIDGI